MHRPASPSSIAQQRQRLLGALALWLAAGSLLLLSQLVPAYSAMGGWSTSFWLVLAPLLMLMALEPRLPWLLLARSLARRRPACAEWN